MRTLGTKQWAKKNCNCFLGCKYNCRYCYAKKKAIRFKRATKDTWKNMIYRKGCEKDFVKIDGTIMFPTTHDLPFELQSEWLPYLTGLLQMGNQILIVSKPQLQSIIAICIYLERFKSQIEFRFTIGTDNEIDKEFWEPDAPSIHERLTALGYAYHAGFKTSVSMEPLLTMDPIPLIMKIDPIVSETIWIGTMNHIYKTDEETWGPARVNYIRGINSKQYLEWLYSRLADNKKIRWKDSIQKILGIKNPED